MPSDIEKASLDSAAEALGLSREQVRAQPASIFALTQACMHEKGFGGFASHALLPPPQMSEKPQDGLGRTTLLCSQSACMHHPFTKCVIATDAPSPVFFLRTYSAPVTNVTPLSISLSP